MYSFIPWKESYDQPRQHIKRQRHYFANKVPYSQSYGFSSSHVQMWVLDHKQSWTRQNWCFWTVALEKIFESPLDYKEIKPVNPNGNQSWIFIGRTDASELWCWRRLLRAPWTARRSNQSILKGINPEYSLEGLILKLQHCGHVMWRADSLEKRPWCWERLKTKEKGVAEDEMAR